MAAWIRPPRTAGSTGPVLVAEAVAEVGAGAGGAVVHAPAPRTVSARATPISARSGTGERYRDPARDTVTPAGGSRRRSHHHRRASAAPHSLCGRLERVATERMDRRDGADLRIEPQHVPLPRE